MQRYYRDLHDRELLRLAESIFGELHRRRMVDVRVPVEQGANQVRCPIHEMVLNGNTLSVVVDRSFEPVSEMLPNRSNEVNASKSEIG